MLLLLFTPLAGADLSIIQPGVGIYPSGQQVNLSFDILDGNKSRISDADCEIQIEDKTSSIISQGAISHNGNWFYLLNTSNTNLTGTYSYEAYCNSSNEAGYLSSSYQITPSGEPVQERNLLDLGDQTPIYLAIFLFLIMVVLGIWQQDASLVSIGGIIAIVTGVVITINGFGEISNLITLGIGVCLIGVGGYIFIRVNIEDIQRTI